MMSSNLYLAEFLGTLMLILFGNGVVAGVNLKKSKGEGSGWIVITAGWGFAVMLGAYATGWISGAYLNPAVTIGDAVVGKLPWNTALGFIVVQMLGAMAGQFLVYLIYKLHYDETEDQGAILSTFATGPAIRNKKWNFLTEALVTMVLVFTFSTVLHSSNNLGGVKPMVAGWIIWAVGLSLGGPTGYAINPARDLGPRIMHYILPLKNKGDSDWDYAWVPVVGPVVGAVVGALIYKLIG